MQIHHDSLRSQLHCFYQGFLSRLGPADRQAITEANAAMRAASSCARMPEMGDLAPDFALPNQHGRLMRLSEQLRYGPVVVMFVRGGWCPFCTITLRAYQAALPAIHEAGGSLFALTPQPPDRCSTMAERDLLAFSTLSDAGNAVADRYAVVYEVPEVVRPLYLRLGHDLPRINKTGNWRVPLPATFLVGMDGRVALADAQPSLEERLEPAKLLATLQRLSVDVSLDLSLGVLADNG